MDTTPKVVATLTNRVLGLYGVDNNFFAVRIGQTRHVFEVKEDESDGYRSALDDVVPVTDQAQLDKLVLPRRVIARVHCVPKPPSADDFGRVDQIWQLIDVTDHYVWLEFGTENSNDYYPAFCFRFTPKPSNLFYRARAVEKAITENG